MRMHLLLPAVVCGFATATVSGAESALAFVDLRAQGGLLASEANAASLSIMAGDIGNKDKHVISFDADMGIVIGLRGLLGRITADYKDLPGDIDLDIGGGSFLGGLGFYLGPNTHAELLGGYGRGACTVDGSHPWDDRVAKYTHYQAELGWYYTWRTNLQVGLTVGYSLIKVKVDTTAGDEKAETDGFDAGMSLGYRF
jgi:hypothetical protein